MNAYARTDVRQFSCVQLLNGNLRTIAFLSGRGAPVVAVTFFRGSQILKRIMFRVGAELDLLERAIARAREPGLEHGRHDIGSFDVGYATVELFVLFNSSYEPAVAFGRIADGTRLGGATKLRGAELDALAEAVAFAKSSHCGAAAQQE